MIAATGRSLLAASAMTLAACATPGDADPGSRLRDPLQEVNRKTFDYNIRIDEAIVAPVARAYRRALPGRVRDSVRNFADNLNSPVTLVNDLMQGEFERARTTLVRFLLNSTIGIAGLGDVAGEIGVPGHKEDFGQTLAVWGVDAGPYVVVPLLGPQTTRNLGGRVVDFAFNPLGYVLTAYDVEWAGVAATAIDAVDQRERLLETVDGMKKTSLDFYAAAQSGYWLYRLSEIGNGRVPTTVPGDEDDIDRDIDDDEAGARPVEAVPKRRSAENRSVERVQ